MLLVEYSGGFVRFKILITALKFHRKLPSSPLFIFLAVFILNTV
jgi:hypothetical protein